MPTNPSSKICYASAVKEMVWYSCVKNTCMGYRETNSTLAFQLVYATMAALRLEDNPRHLLAGLAWRLAILDAWSHDYICSNYTNFNQRP